MAYALEIFFDAQTDAAIRRLWDQLERAGVPTLLTASHQRHDPHVTLAVGEERPKVGDDLVSALKPLPGRTLDFPVLGLFPGDAAVLFLGAKVTAPLLAAHANVHAAIEGANELGVTGDADKMGALYKPGAWVPHCTLALRLDAEGIVRALRELHPYAGFGATIAAVGLVDIATGDVEHLVGS